ncbi:MAG: HEPN domain-containing protein [Nitrospirae bacterium]|nr:HEPN domain-containing protein [Nitrospirota bacterium]
MREEEVASLIKYRLEQAQTVLEDAMFLLKGDRSPNSVVNRAYYAMFYAGLALLQKIGKIPSKHTGVISIFDTEFVMKGIFPKELSKDFHKAFELRQVSDYQTFKPMSKEKAEETLHKAGQFVQAVKEYLDESGKKVTDSSFPQGRA